MPVFTVGTPDGRKIKIDAPDQATAIRGAQEYVAANPATAQISGKVQPRDPNAVPQPSANVEDARPQAPFDVGQALATGVENTVNAIPVIGPMAQNLSDAMIGTGRQLLGQGPMQDYVRQAQAARKQRAQRYPLAAFSGNTAGSIGSFGALATAPAVADALGMGAGKLLPQMGKAGASMLGIESANNMVKGQKPTDAMVNALPAAALSALSPAVARGVEAGGQKVADMLTGLRQNAATNGALRGAPQQSAKELSDLGSQLFDQSTGATPLAVSDTAYNRLFSGIEQVANKFRINANLDQKSVGLLQVLQQIKSEVAQGGVAVDFKDLHLLRQAAQRVAQSSQGRDQAFASAVISNLDDFIRGLKPADILGGADPKAAANALMKGISTWARAKRVGVIEEAIFKAGNVASGLENGLRIEFRKLLQNKALRDTFTPAERQAIAQVANGDAVRNLTRLLGTFGFEFGSGRNMLGGTIGALVGGVPLAIAGTGARKAAEVLGNNAAQRAAQVVATPGIPIVPPSRNMLAGSAIPLQLLLQGGALAAGQ